jgi:hypothetical protein
MLAYRQSTLSQSIHIINFCPVRQGKDSNRQGHPRSSSSKRHRLCFGHDWLLVGKAHCSINSQNFALGDDLQLDLSERTGVGRGRTLTSSTTTSCSCMNELGPWHEPDTVFEAEWFGVTRILGHLTVLGLCCACLVTISRGFRWKSACFFCVHLLCMDYGVDSRGDDQYSAWYHNSL